MKTDLFQSCVHCCVFRIFWHIECSTFTASSFRIWNSSTGIPSPPLASHSRMSDFRWVISPPWLSGSWRSFLYSSFVYSCHLFLISSASVDYKLCVLSHVWLFATPWTVAHQAPVSMEFSRQEYWSTLPFPFPGDLPNPEIEPASLALAGRFFTTEPPGKPCFC